VAAEAPTEGQASTRRPGLGQWAGLAGIVYVVLFVIGAILSYGGGQPDTGSAPDELISYYGDSGHRDKILLGWILVLLGVFFLLWFVAGLRQAVGRLDGNGLLAVLTTIGGAVYAALALAAVSVNAAIKTMSDDTFQDTVYPELIHAADDTAYVLHSAGGIGAAAMMIAASLAALRARVLPAWAGWLGILLGIAAVFSIFFFPQIGIAIWLVVAGVILFRSRERHPV
jgi:hypothetical protein